MEHDTQISNKKYKGYCQRCFIDKFPDEKISRNHRIKENHTTDFIKDEKIRFDKQIMSGSSKRRDLLKEYINKHLITIPNKEITHEYLFYDI
jgi:hypothetical protein